MLGGGGISEFAEERDVDDDPQARVYLKYSTIHTDTTTVHLHVHRLSWWVSRVCIYHAGNVHFNMDSRDAHINSIKRCSAARLLIGMPQHTIALLPPTASPLLVLPTEGTKVG